jgi:hypothetical protein
VLQLYTFQVFPLKNVRSFIAICYKSCFDMEMDSMQQAKEYFFQKRRKVSSEFII